MKNIILIFSILLFSATSFSQEKDGAKKGFCIDNDGIKYEGSFVLKHHVKNPSSNGGGDQNAILVYYKNGKKEEKFKPKELSLVVLEQDTQ